MVFKVNDVPGKEILKTILDCQENEDPYVTVIDGKGLFITPLSSTMQPLETEHEWMESGRKSPTAWRTETDDGFHFLVKKRK